MDVELKAAHLFYAGAGEVPIETKIILSWHNFKETPSQVNAGHRTCRRWSALPYSLSLHGVSHMPSQPPVPMPRHSLPWGYEHAQQLAQSTYADMLHSQQASLPSAPDPMPPCSLLHRRS